MDQLETKNQISVDAATSDTTGTNDFYEDKVKKLTILTEQGSLNWHIVDATTIPTLSFARVLTAYEASFGGERLRLTETGYEQRNLSSIMGGLSSLFSPETNKMSSIAMSLHLLDQNGRPAFKFPSSVAIYELLSEVKMKQLDVAGFLGAIDAAVGDTKK